MIRTLHPIGNHVYPSTIFTLGPCRHVLRRNFDTRAVPSESETRERQGSDWEHTFSRRAAEIRSVFEAQLACLAVQALALGALIYARDLP